MICSQVYLLVLKVRSVVAPTLNPDHYPGPDRWRQNLAVMQIAEANAADGLTVHYFQVVLNQEQVLARRFWRLNGVPILAQLHDNLSDRDLQILAAARGQFSNWPGLIDYMHYPEGTSK